MITYLIRLCVSALFAAALTGFSAYAADFPVNEAVTDKVWKEFITGMEFVRIPKGCFRMGSPAGERGRDPDETQRSVCIKNDYYIGVYEVTNAQYRQFKPSHNSGSYEGFSFNGNTQPVVDVSKHDAAAFAKWLSSRVGNDFRLPTEAEWEFAARAGAKTTFYFGDDESQLCRYANIADRAALMLKGFSDSYTGCNDGYQVTAPVGSFVPNRFGLYDMIGNAWEWTSTLYGLAGYVSPKKLTEAKDKGRWYAIRGGAWNLKSLHARVADRYGRVPEHRTVGIGFRLVMTR